MRTSLLERPLLLERSLRDAPFERVSMRSAPELRLRPLDEALSRFEVVLREVEPCLLVLSEFVGRRPLFAFMIHLNC
jgi:hypothetical protein